MNDQAFCAQCGAVRLAEASFCPSCGRPYAGARAAPDAPSGTNIATAAGVVWLISAVVTAFVGYQRWTLAQALEAAGLSAGDWRAIAAWNAAACLITLAFGARILLRPGRRVLALSVLWAVVMVVGGVAQFASDIGPALVVSVVTAGVAGVLSFVGRAAYASQPTEVQPAPVIPATPPAPVIPATPPTPQSAAPTISPRGCPPRGHGSAHGGRVSGCAHRSGPDDPRQRRASAVEAPSERMSPVLLFLVVLSGLAAVAVIGFALLAGPGSPLQGGVAATPSPVPTPTPRPTPTPVPPGDIVFGLEYDPATLLIAEPRTKFKTTFSPIAWSAALNAPADATEIDLVLSRRSPAGVETTLHGEGIVVPDDQVELIAGVHGSRGARRRPGGDLPPAVDPRQPCHRRGHVQPGALRRGQPYSAGLSPKTV